MPSFFISYMPCFLSNAVCTDRVTIILYISVAGTVTVVNVSGSVVSWSPPVPPNGVILYYNIRISRNDTGELIVVGELDALQIDVATYGEVGGVYTVEVSWGKGIMKDYR